MSSDSESLIKTPRQLIIVVLLAFIVPVLVIVLLVMFVANTPRTGVGTFSLTPEATEARIRPVAGFEFRDMSVPVAARAGNVVYKAQCAACHDTGAAGAPRITDNVAWNPRISQGLDALILASLKGKGAMPAQSGGEFTDHEIALATVYLANRSGADFKDPPAPTVPPQADGAPAAAPPAVAAPGTDAPPAAGPPGTVTMPAATAPAAVAPAVPPVAAAPPVAAIPPPAPATAAAAAMPDGRAIYQKGCNVCHAAGIAGAPRSGDRAAWGDRATMSIDDLTASVIKGKGAMPPRGAVATASDAELRAAVEYMLAQLK
jgi:cytochrome c5